MSFNMPRFQVGDIVKWTATSPWNDGATLYTIQALDPAEKLYKLSWITKNGKREYVWYGQSSLDRNAELVTTKPKRNLPEWF